MSDSSDTAASGSQLVKELVVQNKMGIHARPAAMIVRVTNRFKADVFVEKDDEQVNGKSIMGLMMLAAGHGSVITVSSEGMDADAAINAIGELIGIKRSLGAPVERRHPAKVTLTTRQPGGLKEPLSIADAAAF